MKKVNRGKSGGNPEATRRNHDPQQKNRAMRTEKEVEQICEILRAAYSDVKTQLDYDTPFQLLIATILSAQCTDKQVNAVTPVLFDRFPTPDALAAAPLAEIESLIHSTGFFRNKAKNIQACARTVAEDHDAVIPQNLEGLIQLPGVGRKTANVVLSAAFGQPAVVVDTHVKRISHRLGLTRHSDPTKIEFDLMEILPKSEWNGFGLRLIYFGREICIARKPKCTVCPLFDLCEYPDKHR